MKKLLLVLLFISFAVITTGCSSDSPKKPNNNQKSIDACIKQNGVPILGRSGGYSELFIQDCKFKPEI